MNQQPTTNNQQPFGGYYRRRRVWVTGHTGFKGSWLALWLQSCGAVVHGYALNPPTRPALFEEAGVAQGLHGSTLADVRDAAALAQALRRSEPEVVLHLAAQPLVRAGYADPLGTFASNVMGTAHLLEAVRGVGSVRCVVVVTTDKCYENREWLWGYRETDRLGGHDPYSSSKAGAELVTAAYRSSFFAALEPIVGLASARAGNVIGGGDWARDRLIPDILAAIGAGQAVRIRYPDAIRPWQHVLEPLAGYLWLAASLAAAPERRHDDASLESGFNFGPDSDSNRNVGELVGQVLQYWPGEWADASDGTAPYEARFLHLSTDKAARLLRWRPVWSFDRTITETVEWYRTAVAAEFKAIAEYTRRQIQRYVADAAKAGQPWAAQSHE